MTKAEIDILIREVHLQMEKIRQAKLNIIEQYGKYYAGKAEWSPATEHIKERAELSRTMLGLQQNLVKLRRAMYTRW